MSAEIAALTRYHQKGAPGEALAEAMLLEGLGMEGDMHQGGERQISLLSAEARAWMDSLTEPGLCFGRFRENILIEGMPLDALADKNRLSVGEAVLRIGASGKHCYSECRLLARGTGCRLPGSAAFAVVERGGLVRVGDIVSMPTR